MKYIKIILLIVIFLLLIPINVKASYYYSKADNIEEAKKIAINNNLILKSYNNNIASFYSNYNTLNKNLSFNSSKSELYPDYRMYLCGEDSFYKEISFSNVYRSNICGQGAIVAVIDTGCSKSYFDLKHNIIGCYNVTNNTINTDDKVGHGTCIASIICAEDNKIGMTGIACESKLYIIKCSNDKNEIYYSDVIRAINKSISLGNVNVINLSLGGYEPSDLLKEALENARNHGILVVCAAGNESTNKPFYPASYQVGLSVAASDNKKLSSFSNFGANANIVAPGENIPVYLTKRVFSTESGTSMAAPFVTGAAALVYSQNLNKPRNASTADYVKDLIIQNTDQKIYSNKYGSVKGKLNLQNIFKTEYISNPKNPKIIIKENKQTKQQVIKIKTNKNIDVYYSIGNNKLNKKYTSPIYLDKKGKYKVYFIAYKKNTRVHSDIIKQNIIVENDVYSRKYLESIQLKYDKKQMKIIINTIGKKKIDYSRIKWISSKPKIVKVTSDGTLIISDKAKKGTIIQITAKIGNIKRTLMIKISS